MADISKKTDGPQPSEPSSFDISSLPDYDNDFINEEDLTAFTNALNAPENSPSQEDLTALLAQDGSPAATGPPTFITALNDWRPVRQRIRKSGRNPKSKRKPRRAREETREGVVYDLLKWPLLLTVLGWIIFLGISYLLTRFYIFLYEHWVTWRGKRQRLRSELNLQKSYEDWVKAATKIDAYLGNDRWKTVEEYAYYDSKTIKRVRNHLRKVRQDAEKDAKFSKGLQSSPSPGQSGSENANGKPRPIDELRALAEACIRENFVGFENPRLYSETYYGTKELVQSFVDEAERALKTLKETPQLSQAEKRQTFKHMQTNFGRTALCLSGGATFAYYHFGVAKALLDANLIPQVITGTSGGALVAALLATRTDAELKRLLVPALAHRITACHDSVWVWFRRWWKTGARFDAADWARRLAWFTRGSMTFREAYERTGRILNVSCVPSDPHSPAILANHLTSPDCVIWSAVLASAAVPGILNPVVLMKKNPDGTLGPYSFGHKWKDGSLRTDIPLKALNLHFNVNFSIVSQVNPHVNLFFFSSRGTVGRPVTHRRGRGWRGGFLGSAVEQYLKLDLTKWLKVLRHLELLPRPLGQDWSQLWLQKFSGTVTIWPKSLPSDFIYILSDPSPDRLARMIRLGQLSTWPKLKFIGNRIKLERLIEQGRRVARAQRKGQADVAIFSEDEQPHRPRGFRTNEWRRTGIVDDIIGKKSDDDGDQLLRPTITGKTEDGFSPQIPLIPSNVLTRRSPRSTPLPGTPRISTPPPSSMGERFRGWFRRNSSATNQLPPTSARRSGVKTAPVTEYSSPVPGELQRQGSLPRPRSSNSIASFHSKHGHQSPQIQDHRRRGSVIAEMARQSQIFFDDEDFDRSGSSSSEDEFYEEEDDHGLGLGVTQKEFSTAPTPHETQADEHDHFEQTTRGARSPSHEPVKEASKSSDSNGARAE